MKFVFSIFSSLIFFSSIAQNNLVSEVGYTFYINNGNATITTDCSLIHFHDLNKSTFINFGFKDIPEESTTKKTNVNGVEEIKIDKYDNDEGQKPEYQKDFAKDSLWSFENIYGEKKYHIIKEDLPDLKWNIQNDTKQIIGIATQKATIKFRGREYEAWFAPTIQINNGPFKFHGLPGLILEIRSLDNSYRFEAYKLNLFKKEENLVTFKVLTEKYNKAPEVDIKEKLALVKKNEEKEVKYQLSRNPNITEYKIQNNSIEKEFPNFQ